MQPRYYILDHDGDPVPVNDVLIWSRWFETSERIVAKFTLGNVTVSTVFLGLNHNYRDDGPPILYETMIFGGPHDEYQDRYATRDEAIAGHAKAVALAAGV